MASYQERPEDRSEDAFGAQPTFGPVHLGLHGSDALLHRLDHGLDSVDLPEGLLQLLVAGQDLGQQVVDAEAGVEAYLRDERLRYSVWPGVQHLLTLSRRAVNSSRLALMLRTEPLSLFH